MYQSTKFQKKSCENNTKKIVSIIAFFTRKLKIQVARAELSTINEIYMNILSTEQLLRIF